MLGSESYLTLGRNCIQSHEAAGFLLCAMNSSDLCCCLRRAGELQALLRGQTQAAAAPAGGCGQLPPQTITHVAE